jgi:hypothetical protein
MPKKGHTEKQIVTLLRQVEAGVRVDDICRKVGISQATSLEAVVFRGGGERAARAAAVARGEQAAEAVGGGPEHRSADPAGDRVKKCMVRRVTATK